MFRRQDDSGLAERDTAVIRHGIGNAAEYLFRCVGAVVLHITEPTAGKNGDAADPIWKVLFLDKQGPRVAAAPFSDAEAVFSRVALCRLVRDTGNHPEHVHQDQPDRTPDGRVRPVAGAEEVHIRIHPELFGHRAADDK